MFLNGHSECTYVSDVTGKPVYRMFQLTSRASVTCSEQRYVYLSMPHHRHLDPLQEGNEIWRNITMYGCKWQRRSLFSRCS